MRESSDGNGPALDVDEIRPVVEEYPITLAVLYGSYARGDVRPGSDIDLAIEFEPSLSDTKRTTVRLDLIARLSELLETDDIDVIPLDQASRALQQNITVDGIVLYGDSDALERYQTDVGESTHEERVAEFDAILAELERVV